jgi:RHS repeat-associated protein
MLQTNTTVDCLYMTDIVGNPVLLSTSFNTTAYAMTYDPYGAATTTGGPNGGTLFNPYVFHFGLQDRTTGNVKFGARFYDPTTGSWTQQDTYNAPLDPHNANRYLYAGGDPINYVDATGTDFGSCYDAFFGEVIPGIFGIAGAIALAVTPDPSGATKAGAYFLGIAGASAVTAGVTRMISQC